MEQCGALGGRKWVPPLRASLIFVRCQKKENRGGLSLPFFLVPISVRGGARVRKGSCSQLAGRVGIRGLWVVPGEWPICVRMSPFESRESVPLSLVEDWDGSGRWEPVMILLKVCHGLEGLGPTLVHRVRDTCFCLWFEGKSRCAAAQGPHPAVSPVSTSSGANRIPTWLWWLPTPLPWHSWSLSQCPNQECWPSCSSSSLSAPPFLFFFQSLPSQSLALEWTLANGLLDFLLNSLNVFSIVPQSP